MRHVQTAIAAGLVVAMGLTAWAQDSVRLKNGRTLSGTITVDESDAEGFRVTRWDNGATIHVKWSQVPDAEARRLQGLGAQTTVAAAVGDVLDGVRIVTANREVLGVMTSEDAQQVLVKIAASPTPVPVPKAAILSRENLKISEQDAYSADEMLARRLEGLNENDASALLTVGKFAQALKLYDHAMELYQKASAIGESSKEVEPLIAALTTLIREGQAQAALAEVRSLADETRYDEAIAAAQKFIEAYADTETGRKNAELVSLLEKEAKEFETNRASILAAKIPDAWKNVRSSLFSEYASNKYKLAEARSATDKMDAEIAKRIGDKFKCTQDEAELYWNKREKKKTSASLGTGTWIALGGQDGGMDFTGNPDAGEGSDNPVDDFVKKFGGRNQGGNRGKPQKKIEYGKKLQTSEEWWQSVSNSTRKEWLEAYYAMNSALVDRSDLQVEEKNCSACRGEGIIKSVRNGKALDAICWRCHGVKVDQTIPYK